MFLKLKTDAEILLDQMLPNLAASGVPHLALATVKKSRMKHQCHSLEPIQMRVLRMNRNLILKARRAMVRIPTLSTMVLKPHLILEAGREL